MAHATYKYFLCLFSIKRNLLSLKQIIIRDLLFICLTCRHVIISSFFFASIHSQFGIHLHVYAGELWLLKIAKSQPNSTHVWFSLSICWNCIFFSKDFKQHNFHFSYFWWKFACIAFIRKMNQEISVIDQLDRFFCALAPLVFLLIPSTILSMHA